MVTGGCGQGHIQGTVSLLWSRRCSPAPSPLWVPPAAGMGLSARLWGCCTAAGCVKDGMLLPFPVSLGAACMAEVQAIPVGAGWHQPSARARGGSWARSTEGWSHVLLFLGNSPGAVAVTTLTRTFGGYFGCPEVLCPIWESLVQPCGGCLIHFKGGEDLGQTGTRRRVQPQPCLREEPSPGRDTFAAGGSLQNSPSPISQSLPALAPAKALPALLCLSVGSNRELSLPCLAPRTGQ